MRNRKLIVKVCGMTDGNNIRQVEQLGVDMLGMIFYPKSPRCLCHIPEYLPAHAHRVGVFVNESKENVAIYADRFGLDYIQLHGNESPEYCHSLRNALGLPLIKAFSIATSKDLATVHDYNGLCDYYLFDAKCVLYGGSGNQFDWNLLHRYTGPTPFLLSGGINSYSAKAIHEFHHPHLAGIDLNSRFETKPGMKDVERIRTFLKKLEE